MRLVCHEVGKALEMVAASSQRAWMDATPQRYAYRCIPLSIANGSGWDLLSPCTFAATWDGGVGEAAIKLEALDGYTDLHLHAVSHFGSGILTFHPGYLFQTEPGWGVVARGSPNQPKHGIHALEGLIETDWLPFTFTMNWLFTQPGRVVFEKGESLCFITPVPQLLLENITPEIANINASPEVKAEYDAWSKSRNEFNAALKSNKPEVVKQGWQKHYVRGETATGAGAVETHRSKRRLATPVRLEKPLPLIASPLLMNVGDGINNLPPLETNSPKCPMGLGS